MAVAWIRLDDRFDEHPKIIDAGPIAAMLWLSCIAYSNRNLTDGLVPAAIVRSKSWSLFPEKPTQPIEDLCRVGLLDPAENGFQLHDYLEYQPSAKSMKKRQKDWRDRQEKSRSKSRSVSRVTTRVTPHDVTVGVTAPVPVPKKEASSSLSASVGLFDLGVNTNVPPSAMGTRRGVKRKALENGEKLPEGEITADQAFEEIFWPEYPRKTDKHDARKAWKALHLKDTDEAKILAIMDALRHDVSEEWRSWPPDKIPYPATWINRKRWLDG